METSAPPDDRPGRESHVARRLDVPVRLLDAVLTRELGHQGELGRLRDREDGPQQRGEHEQQRDRPVKASAADTATPAQEAAASSRVVSKRSTRRPACPATRDRGAEEADPEQRNDKPGLRLLLHLAARGRRSPPSRPAPRGRPTPPPGGSRDRGAGSPWAAPSLQVSRAAEAPRALAGASAVRHRLYRQEPDGRADSSRQWQRKRQWRWERRVAPPDGRPGGRGRPSRSASATCARSATARTSCG